MNFPDGSKSKKEYLINNFGTMPEIYNAFEKACKPEIALRGAINFDRDIDWSKVNITNLILFAEKSKPRHQRYLSLYMEHIAVGQMCQLNGG